MTKIYTFLAAILIAISANAVNLNEAKALYNNGEYSEALSAFKTLLAKSSKDANLNNYAGLCLYNLFPILP